MRSNAEVGISISRAYSCIKKHMLSRRNMSSVFLEQFERTWRRLDGNDRCVRPKMMRYASERANMRTDIQDEFDVVILQTANVILVIEDILNAL
jgi:hypothetical protein